jgi:aromatic-L-amino-acid decarboxylase
MPSVPLDPDDATRRALGEAVIDFASRFVGDHHDGPAVGPALTSVLLDELLAPPAELGTDIASLLSTVEAAIVPGLDNASGRFLGYIPNGGLFAGALGSFVSAVANQYTGGAHAGAGFVALEESVLGWMAALFQLPPTAGGLLLSGGSIANLTAVVTARGRLGDRFDDGVVYASERAHHSIVKATRIAGIAPHRVRAIPTDDQQRMDAAALAAAMADDAAAGLRPMLVAATGGTTDTGAIDPLAACADTAVRHGAWFHVDAAYGGFFAMTDRGAARLAGIERADSITVDAHKSLLLPFGVGGLLVRDRAALVDAHEARAAYLQDLPQTVMPHYMTMGPELTRPSRGVAVWLALHLHGVAAFRTALDEMLDHAVHVAARLRQLPGITVLGDPALSIVAFRARDDRSTRLIMDAVHSSGAAYLSSTSLDGQVWVRVALLSQRTTRAIVDEVIDTIAEANANLSAVTVR